MYNIGMNPELYEYAKKNFNAPGKALDLGCGDGTDMCELTKMGWQCDGVDILTGIDLNEPYLSKNAPYDFVYSNYVIHKLDNPDALVMSIENNLKEGGKFFLHTFDQSDNFAKKTYTEAELRKLFDNKSLQVESCEKLKVWDDEPGHKHYHWILQASGVKG